MSAERIAVVTGATTGIGLNFVHKLVIKGSYSRIILLTRTMEEGADALSQLQKALAVSSQSQTDKVSIELVPCDLASLKAVALCCHQLKSQLPHINLLVLNAGLLSGPAVSSTSATSEDGLELIMAINLLAHIYMATALRTLLSKTAPGGGRLVITSSDGHRFASVPDNGRFEGWTKIMTELGTTSCTTAYANSKLALVQFAKEYDLRYRSSGITTIVIHPGVVQSTNIWGKQSGLSYFLIAWLAFPIGHLLGLWQTVDEAGNTILTAATAENDRSGQYLNVTKWEEPSAVACDEKVAAFMWKAAFLVIRQVLGNDALSDVE